jgi:uncharacterized protein (DUF885 family)
MEIAMKKKQYGRVRLLFMIVVLAAALGVYGWQSGKFQQSPSALLEHPSVEDTRSGEEIRQAFDDFMQQIFVAQVDQDTLTRNFTLSDPEKYGIQRQTTSLGEYSLSAFQNDIIQSENWLASLEQYDYDVLNEEEQLEYDIIHSMLQTDLKSSEVLEYMECLGPTTGIQAQLPLLLAEYHFTDREDIEQYLDLLELIPDYFEQIISFETMKSKENLFMGDTTAQAIIRQCETFVKQPEQNYLLTTFWQGIQSVEGLTDKEKKSYQKQNKKAVLKKVIPAYENLIDGLKSLCGTGNNEGGVCKLPKGKQYYEYLVESQTGSARSVQDIRKMLEQALTNSQKELSRIMTESPDAYYDAENVTYPRDNPVETVSYLKEKIKDDFESLPDRITCQVKYVDESLEDSLSPALYLTSPIDDYENNVVYLNQSQDYDLEDAFSTIAHESYPGHLYQNAYFLSTDPSPLRSVISVGGYAEGWGTYAEWYSYQLADLDENVADLLAQNLIATLCLYGKADIEVNYNGWSQKKLISYLKEYGFDGEQGKIIYDAVVAEPVSYLQYIVGYLEIQELSDTAQKQLGDKFSLKEFHKFYLGTGNAPFVVLQDRLQDWIRRQKQ